MTSKKLIKELMALGVSRNNARKGRDIAREEGLSNEAIYYAACEVLLAMLEKGLGIYKEVKRE